MAEVTVTSEVTPAAIGRMAACAGIHRKSKMVDQVREVFDSFLTQILLSAYTHSEGRSAAKVGVEDIESAVAELGFEWTVEPGLDIKPVGKASEYFAQGTRAFVTPMASFDRKVKELGYVLTADACHNCQWLVETLTIKFLVAVREMVSAISSRTTIKGEDVAAVAANFTLLPLCSLEIAEPPEEEPKPAKASAKSKAKAKAVAKAKGKAKVVAEEEAEEEEEVSPPPKKAKAVAKAKAKAKAVVEDEEAEEEEEVAPPPKKAKAVAKAKAKKPAPVEVEEDEE